MHEMPGFASTPPLSAPAERVEFPIQRSRGHRQIIMSALLIVVFALLAWAAIAMAVQSGGSSGETIVGILGAILLAIGIFGMSLVLAGGLRTARGAAGPFVVDVDGIEFGDQRVAFAEMRVLAFRVQQRRRRAATLGALLADRLFAAMATSDGTRRLEIERRNGPRARFDLTAGWGFDAWRSIEAVLAPRARAHGVEVVYDGEMPAGR